MKRIGLAVAIVSGVAAATRADDSFFPSEVAPILEQHCVRCHQGREPEGGVDLTRAEGTIEGLGDGWIVVPGQPDESHLLDVVAGERPRMPKFGDPLSEAQVDVLRAWIAAGADWPDGLVLEERQPPLWSLKPLARPPLPELAPQDAARVRTPVDAFVLAKLREVGLRPAPEADRRTLIRRLFFNLTGLPPSPEEIDAFVHDADPRAYENLVERLLDSPHYGERWGRHWLDVARYGDTHGFEKDKLRPHAWPYRDYVIRSFNEDKPYARFVKEQLAGDWFYPETRDGIVGPGFVAAGPFDWVGHIELREGTLDKAITRNLDRDDMVSATMNTFVSLTAQCARCHDHKFDPISQEDYYGLQSVFAAVDRADRPYDPDPEVARRRRALGERRASLAARQAELDREIAAAAGPELADVEERLTALDGETAPRPEFGYHSAIEPRQDAAKWVQVDLGRSVEMAHVVFVGCHDDFNQIGAGFGFPVRYRIELSDDPEFGSGVSVVADHTRADVSNPGVSPQSVAVGGQAARYVRMTATKLAPRQNDYIFALAELMVLTPGGDNAALGAGVTALDSIEAPPRWGRRNLVDGDFSGSGGGNHAVEIARLHARRQDLLERAADPGITARRAEVARALEQAEAQLAALPPQELVYAAATHFEPQGSFRPTHGVPRPIYVLNRGSEDSPLHEVGPGTVSCLPDLPARFELPEGHDEAQRRAALAEWIVDPRNPLTWRSIVNRVWQHHFGRGIVATPNDFGRMGAAPTHPELLDWLAVEFRDGGQSLKALHRLILNSAAWRQASFHEEDQARLDADNRYLWRMNRQRLEAEAIRDAVLAVSGRLDRRMGGPGYKPFGFMDDHSPHYKYDEHDPDDPLAHRRSIYRFIVRSVPDPFLETLDCADPSQSVARRNETLTPLQALALLNNPFVVRMAEHFARRVEPMGSDPARRIEAAYRLALGRAPTAQERGALVPIAEQHGMANVCRLILNTNEFVFVD